MVPSVRHSGASEIMSRRTFNASWRTDLAPSVIATLVSVSLIGPSACFYKVPRAFDGAGDNVPSALDGGGHSDLAPADVSGDSDSEPGDSVSLPCSVTVAEDSASGTSCLSGSSCESHKPVVLSVECVGQPVAHIDISVDHELRKTCVGHDQCAYSQVLGTGPEPVPDSDRPESQHSYEVTVDSADSVEPRETLFHGVGTLAVVSNCTRYVDELLGDDNKSGDMNRPWKTITHAMGSATAGDVVCIRGGTYSEFITDIRGSSSDPIVYQRYPGEAVVIGCDPK